MRYLIRASWVVLICCFIVKLFGGNYFEIVCENENFVMICNFIDNNFWLKVIVNCINALILISLNLLAIMQRKFYNKIQLVVFIPLIILSSILSWFSTIGKFIVDFIVMILLPIIFKTNIKRIIFGNLLILCFQIISLIVKDIGLNYLNNESTLVVLILNIDVFLMSFLYYLYANKKTKEE